MEKKEKRVERLCYIVVEEIIADTAYSGKDNLAKMKKEAIQPVVPLNPVVHSGGERQDGFDYNKDANFVVCPAGEHSIRKAIQGSKKAEIAALSYSTLM